MMKTLLVALALLAAAPANAFWPFSSGPKKAKPPRLHTLLAKANDLIEQAEDKTMAGDAEAALDLYRQALAELTRVAEENPDRAETQEFAPLRHKAEACAAAIDNIRFDQVNRNSRPVVLTDTSALERRYAEKHSLASLRRGQSGAAQEPPPQEPPPEPPPAAAPVAPSKLALAKTALKEGRFEEAARLAGEAAAEDPDSLNALLVKAAAQWKADDLYGAKATLVHARRAFPESPLPYYNLSRLAIVGGNMEAARKYYRLGRDKGGAVDPALEEALKK